MQTAERISSFDPSDNVIYQRHLVAYNFAAGKVYGKMLEVGCGEGYGTIMLADKVKQVVAIDKFTDQATQLTKDKTNIDVQQMEIPPLQFADNTFDTLVSFQVIEHIEKDHQLVKEMHRVLKPGGLAILTTPNRTMSLTRNPWHIREYQADELTNILSQHFDGVEMYGVFGNQKVNDYYNANKAAVEKITRFDVFNLQYKLPRQFLQIPYDVLNRLNRRKLMQGNQSLVSNITASDYYIAPATEKCFDLLAVAVK